MAFIFSGIMIAAEDLNGSSLDRPPWTYNPTPGMFLLAATTWFLRPFLPFRRQTPRTIVFGALRVGSQMTTSTLVFLIGLFLSGLVFENIFFRVIVTIIAAPMLLIILSGLVNMSRR